MKSLITRVISQEKCTLYMYEKNRADVTGEDFFINYRKNKWHSKSHKLSRSPIHHKTK